MSGEIDRIRKLSGWRARPERGAGLDGDVAGFARELRKLERSIGAATDAWARLAPAELPTCATVETLRGGTLTLCVDCSAAAYEV
ncbi:MAG: DciA family protein, partial [Planctomycetota bacterium]